MRLDNITRYRVIFHNMPIKILDEATVNQIAAGEVVERTVSVVKELVKKRP